MTKLIIMAQIETEDPRLSPEALATAVKTAEGAAEIRRLALAQLPSGITRLVAILPEDQARALMALHEVMLAEHGAPGFVRPPDDYVAPKDQGKGS